MVVMLVATQQKNHKKAVIEHSMPYAENYDSLTARPSVPVLLRPQRHTGERLHRIDMQFVACSLMLGWSLL
jgi:hypothetical protein